MKVSKIYGGLLLVLSLLLVTSAFAANKGSLQLTDPVSVGGKQLAPGDYTVKWEGKGPDVELNILHGSKVVMTTSARLVDLGQSADMTAAVFKTNPDGSRSLSQIRFGGKKYALAIGNDSAGSTAGDSAR